MCVGDFISVIKISENIKNITQMNQPMLSMLKKYCLGKWEILTCAFVTHLSEFNYPQAMLFMASFYVTSTALKTTGYY